MPIRIHPERGRPGVGQADCLLIGRRAILRHSLVSGGMAFSGLSHFFCNVLAGVQRHEGIEGSRQLGVVPFAGEGSPPMGEPIGAELDGRLFTDLSHLQPENPITPSREFYVRTRASNLLDLSKPWSIRMSGLTEKSLTLWAHDLQERAQPMGLILMECAGNSRSAHFGMLSVADWEGVSLLDIFEAAGINQPANAQVLISGFDQYSTESRTSVPGAGWIFSLDQLHSSRASLATEMNGQPLSPDHGAPVRLLVPGWYGCACIKWVNEITFVTGDAAATSQMQEYAGRTMQIGMPRLARDYQPATIDFAAMPVRIEKWSANGKIKYRVVGIQWGNSSSVKGLEIRLHPEEDFVAVENFHLAGNDSWSFWSHVWVPRKVGKYVIRLRRRGAQSVSRRLDSGYYDRAVEIIDATEASRSWR
jgi:DMSO/TMAO reductase YedYZ molybdopterin-dependent catalytic subunit